MRLIKYLKEVDFLKNYVFAAFIPLVLFYTSYLLLDPDLVLTLTDEDHFYEWLTVLFFLGAAWYSYRMFRSSRNVFFILFAAAFFFAAGEEISWGQRLIGFNTPDIIREINVQEEFTLHNLEIFNTHTHEGDSKSGLARILEINFLFRLGTLVYGILVPLLAFHSGAAAQFTRWLQLPVPPISLGFFFLVNWMTYRTLHSSMISYPGGGSEIFECLAAYILFILFLFFYREKNNINCIGYDIKESFEDDAPVPAIDDVKRN